MVVRRKTSEIEIVKVYVQTKGTMRSVAKQFGISKSTVYTRLKEFILKPNKMSYEKTLALEAKELIRKNISERHLRGGIATRKKLLEEKAKKV